MKAEHTKVRVPVSKNNICIQRDESKCILCGACRSTCKLYMDVYGNYDLDKVTHPICVGCGQCVMTCPTGALHEKEDYQEVEKLIHTKGKTIVFTTAPAVRVTLGEEFGMEPGTDVTGKMVSALRKLGGDYIFDTTFGADITIMEEATELITRLQSGKNLPMFTSCCPSWVKYIETFRPDLIKHLSTTKSPISCQASVIMTYFAKKYDINPGNIINIAVTPCTAKKFEIKRREFKNDVDYVITTRELAKWIKEKNIDFTNLKDGKYDELMDTGTGAGVIFGNSGGVMEAALRTAYHNLTGDRPTPDLLKLTPVRGLQGVKEARVSLGSKNVRVAVVCGTHNANKLLENLKDYDFIEVMACPGGCIAGGGTPKTTIPLSDKVRLARINGLYNQDAALPRKSSYQNPDIIKLYQEFLDYPMSPMAEAILHTDYHSRKSDLGE